MPPNTDDTITLLILPPQIKFWTRMKRKAGREKCGWLLS